MQTSKDAMTAFDLWRSASEADNRHETSGYERFFSDDLVVHLVGGSTINGLDAYRSFIHSIFDALPDYEATPLQVLSDETTVFVHWTIRGTHRGTLFGVAATGVKVTYSGCSVWHLDGDRLAEAWWYPDRATLERQLEDGR